MAVTRRLSKKDWTTAALAALADRGVSGVAVEPLAAALGSTKGSFYWHFANREELLRAALDRWENTETDDVIAGLERLRGTDERLRALFRLVLGAGRPDLSVRLAGDADHPIVGPALHRITQRRVAYVAAQLEAIGIAPDVARRRATLAYAAYIGWGQLRRADPGGDPAPGDVGSYVDELMRLVRGQGATEESA